MSTPSRLVITLCCCLSAAAQRNTYITVAEARSLVYDALSKRTKQLPGLSIVANKEAKGRCLTFDVLWANPGPGSAHVDFYTVDLQTGAIWSGILCDPVVARRVARMQRELRKHAGITEAAFREAVERNVCLE
jgi:hypothetical protein